MVDKYQRREAFPIALPCPDCKEEVYNLAKHSASCEAFAKRRLDQLNF